jgi:hypothetical protein
MSAITLTGSPISLSPKQASGLRVSAGFIDHGDIHPKLLKDTSNNKSKNKLGFFESLWQKFKAWIGWKKVNSPSKSEAIHGELSINGQLHRETSQKTKLPKQTVEPGSSKATQKNTTPTPNLDNNGHVHTGGCCGSSSPLSSVSSTKILRSHPITSGISHNLNATNQNLLDSPAAINASAKLANALQARLIENRTDRAFQKVLNSDTIFKNHLNNPANSSDREFAKNTTRKTLKDNPAIQTPHLTKVLKQAMTDRLDAS